jgi:hypothetical protein
MFLNRAGDAVERMVILENRNPRFELPTTGAVAGRSSFCMANTQIYRTGEGGRSVSRSFRMSGGSRRHEMPR